MDAKPLLTITALKGLNTNAPRGTHEQPTTLLNAYLDRTGGYSGQYAKSLQLTGVADVRPALYANDLFIEKAGGQIAYYDAQAGTTTNVPNLPDGSSPGPLSQSIALMPGLLLARNGMAYVLKASSKSLAGTGVTAAEFSFTYGTPAAGVTGYDPGTEYDVLLVAQGRKDVFTTTTKRGSATLLVGNGHPDSAGAAPPAGGFLLTVRYTDQSASFETYVRQHGSQQPWVFGGYSYQALNGINASVTPAVGPSLARVQDQPIYLSLDTTGGAASAYHQGRVYLAPASSTYFDPAAPTGLSTKTIPNRIYYSAVIAAATDLSLPRWDAIQFLDAPFRVSRRVVALLSVGTYLYIFGDRELLILVGNPEYGGRIENIGDSIGVVAAGSVQQLGGVGYWLSDSGVMAVRGGQVQEVGADVRDWLSSYSLGSVSSTVDFNREIYTLTDGTSTLMLHARENGWTSRAQSESGTLYYGGGTPYAVNAGNLYSIGGERDNGGSLPARLTFTATWGPFECGSWTLRKHFRAVSVGIDLASLPGTLTQTSTVYQRNDILTSDAQAVTLPAGPGYSTTHLVQDGTGMSGVSVEPRLTFSTQDTRGILRGPLQIAGATTGEVSVD